MKGTRLGILLLVIVILLIALIQAGQQTPIDWSKTYNPHDKRPFGTFVINKELQNIFPENRSFKRIDQSIYTYFEDSTPSAKAPRDFLYIGSRFTPGKASIKALLSFARQGNNVFLSTNNLSKLLEDTFHLKTSYFNDYLAGISVRNDSVFYSLPASHVEVLAPKYPSQTFFSQLNDSLTTILGYLRRDTISVPDFVKIKFGKGNFYLHLYPESFSNYYLLDSATYSLSYDALHHLEGTHLLWYDGLWGAKEYHTARTPLRFILSKPPLRTAWYLLLITLLLFLIFKSKREQKAIPIIEPEKNLSVSFAETIGALYYESGNPEDMVQKKVKYFLYFLKKEFRLENIDIENVDFRKKAALRMKRSEKEIKTFFDKIYFYQNKPNPTSGDLKDLNDHIENFKQKINLK